MDWIKPLSPPQPRDVLRTKPKRARPVYAASTTDEERPLVQAPRSYDRRKHSDRRRKTVPVAMDRRSQDRRNLSARRSAWRRAYMTDNHQSPMGKKPAAYQNKRLKSLLPSQYDKALAPRKGRFLDEEI